MMNLKQIMRAEGLTEEEREMLRRLLDVWQQKLTRNTLKSRYYEGRNKLVNFGIAIPPNLETVEAVVGWPALAVDKLQVRSVFDGFTFGGANADKMKRIMDQNQIAVGYEQAVTSELVHSCVFPTISRGREGEPAAVINFHSAETAAALWDYRKKRIKCGLVVVDIAYVGRTSRVEPTWVNLHTDEAVIEIRKDGKRWIADKKKHPMGRPMMDVMAYRPSLKRPFGKSRISRAVMSTTDSAVRTCLRSELGAEFYTTPQKYLLGADEKDFDKPKWEAYIGSVFLAGRDPETGELPQFGQLPQASMQPHTDYLRTLAAKFSGETSVPVSELGIIHDNPSSAEAIYAAKESLIIEAASLNKVNGEALRNIAMMAVAIVENKALKDLTEEERDITVHFRNPARPSIVSQADAMVKIAAAAPWIAETEVFLEELGFDEDTRRRLMSDKRRSQARMMLTMNQPKAEDNAAE